MSWIRFSDFNCCKGQGLWILQRHRHLTEWASELGNDLPGKVLQATGGDAYNLHIECARGTNQAYRMKLIHISAWAWGPTSIFACCLDVVKVNILALHRYINYMYTLYKLHVHYMRWDPIPTVFWPIWPSHYQTKEICPTAE